MEMTRNERVRTVILHKSPDTVPYNIELTSGSMERFREYKKDETSDFFDFSGNHIEKISYNGGQWLDKNFFSDEFGVVWNRSEGDDIGVVKEYHLSEPEISAIKIPVVDKAEIERKTKKILSNGHDSFKLAKIGMLLFERAWSLRGMADLLMDFYLNPEFLETLLDRITDYNLEIINEALQYPVDGFYFGDDYGQQTGMIMGPKLWRQFIKPRLERTFAPIKAKGLPVFLHSCGNIYDILGDLIDIGLDVYQTVQPEIYDLKKIKKEFGKDLSFYGAISTQQSLPYISPDQVKELLKDTIAAMNIDGGYICAPTHQIPADVPPENIMAMIEYLKC
jgi:uroporphyrinogen decarboxylase